MINDHLIFLPLHDLLNRMVPLLIIMDGPSRGEKIELGDVTAVGRSAENDLVLGNPSVSRRHARIMKRGASFFIEDLSSAHGTTVGDERITSRELKDGDLIGFGPVSARFTFGGNDEAPVDTTEVLHVLSTNSLSSSGTSRSIRRRDDASSIMAFERLNALLAMVADLQGEANSSLLLEKAARLLVDTMDADRCGIFRSRSGGPDVVISGMAGDKGEAGSEPGSLPFSKTLLSRSFDRGEAIVTADAGRDSRFSGTSLTGGSIRAAMAAPLWGRERILGVVVIENRGTAGAFDENDLRLLIAVAGITGTALENSLLIEEIKREVEERAALSRFLSPAVAEKIRAAGLNELKGERRETTVLFTDIRGFTSLSESLPPDELLDGLNRAFEIKTSHILNEEGTIDKFTGDGVLALFGAPVPQEDHAARALRAAISIRESCRNLSTSSGAPLDIGIGLATGTATVGPVGSRARLEYTAIGDVVNVAARLVARADGGGILASAAVVEAARRTGGGGAFEVKHVGTVPLKGKIEGVEIVEII